MKEKILKSSLLYTLLSIAIGFLLGAVLLQAIGVSPVKAYGKLYQGVFGKPKFMFYSIIYGAPLIFTGLSVACSFRTGIFNIGAEGQFVMGSLAAVVVGILFPLPAPLHVLLCLVVAALAGAFWGFLVGLLKVKKGINEVLSYIMFNWIAFYFSNYVVNLKTIHTDQGAEASKNILASASMKIPQSFIPFAGASCRSAFGFAFCLSDLVHSEQNHFWLSASGGGLFPQCCGVWGNQFQESFPFVYVLIRCSGRSWWSSANLGYV